LDRAVQPQPRVRGSRGGRLARPLRVLGGLLPGGDVRTVRTYVAAAVAVGLLGLQELPGGVEDAHADDHVAHGGGRQGERPVGRGLQVDRRDERAVQRLDGRARPIGAVEGHRGHAIAAASGDDLQHLLRRADGRAVAGCDAALVDAGGVDGEVVGQPGGRARRQRPAAAGTALRYPGVLGAESHGASASYNDAMTARTRDSGGCLRCLAGPTWLTNCKQPLTWPNVRIAGRDHLQCLQT
jgi:hypothetical protein